MLARLPSGRPQRYAVVIFRTQSRIPGLPTSPGLSIEVLGHVAGALTTFAFLPQTVKTLRSRSAGDLSATMLLAYACGILMWILYGLAVRSRPLVITNTLTLGLTIFLLSLKLRH